MWPAFSRLLYRLIGGERGRSLSWGIATHKDRNTCTRALYGLAPSHFDESLQPSSEGFFYEDEMKYEQGPLDEFPKSLRQFTDWQKEQGIKADGIYGNESHKTMWDYLKMLKDKLESADAKIMELSIRLDECVAGCEASPVDPEQGSVASVLALIGIGVFIGFLAGAVVF